MKYFTKNKNGIRIAKVCASCANCKTEESVDQAGRFRRCSIPIDGQEKHIVLPTGYCNSWLISEKVASYALHRDNMTTPKCKAYLAFVLDVRRRDSNMPTELQQMNNEQLRALWEKKHKRSVYIDL